MEKLSVCLTGFYFTISALCANAQVPVVDYTGDSIPEKYQLQFKEEGRAFLAYTNPSAEDAGKTFNLLSAVEKGYIKSFDKDSLAKV